MKEVVGDSVLGVRHILPFHDLRKQSQFGEFNLMRDFGPAMDGECEGLPSLDDEFENHWFCGTISTGDNPKLRTGKDFPLCAVNSLQDPFFQDERKA